MPRNGNEDIENVVCEEQESIYLTYNKETFKNIAGYCVSQL